ncbi:MAG TPA: hypothetical protein VNA17_04060, partial [Pyrinomonadaceae bacterium]|nr:hypothetical protein [Pyrinomonadaceae bacterium]
MSNFRVQLDNPPAAAVSSPKISLEPFSNAERRSKQLFLIGFASVAGIILTAIGGVFLYYQSLKDTPQYSLALL